MGPDHFLLLGKGPTGAVENGAPGPLDPLN